MLIKKTNKKKHIIWDVKYHIMFVSKVIATKEASPEKGVTMEKIIEMQKKRKEEKPVKMLIKGGMLFKVVMMMMTSIRTIITITMNMMVMIMTCNNIYNEDKGNDNDTDDDCRFTDSHQGRHDD